MFQIHVHCYVYNIYILVYVLAFLTSGKTNVIVVDWTVAAAEQRYASESVPAIGGNIAELVKLLAMFGKISRRKLHLVGFDLGAHVVGCAGRNFNDVARITGEYKVEKYS